MIDVAPEVKAPHTDGMDHKALHWLDLAPVDTQALKDASHKMAQAITKGGVVIECKLGLQRSVLVVLAYLIVEKSMTTSETYSIVKEKRTGAVLREEQLSILEVLIRFGAK